MVVAGTVATPLLGYDISSATAKDRIPVRPTPSDYFGSYDSRIRIAPNSFENWVQPEELARRSPSRAVGALVDIKPHRVRTR